MVGAGSEHPMGDRNPMVALYQTGGDGWWLVERTEVIVSHKGYETVGSRPLEPISSKESRD